MGAFKGGCVVAPPKNMETLHQLKKFGSNFKSNGLLSATRSLEVTAPQTPTGYCDIVQPHNPP